MPTFFKYIESQMLKRSSTHTGTYYFKRHKNESNSSFLPIFKPSGLLNREFYDNKNVNLSYIEPHDSISPIKYYNSRHIPVRKRTRFEAILYKKGDDKPLNNFELIDQSIYVIGKQPSQDLKENSKIDQNDITPDIPIDEDMCSEQHCMIQFRNKDGQLSPYIIDWDSLNGTTLNDVLIPKERFIQLKNGDTLQFSEWPDKTNYELVFMAI